MDEVGTQPPYPDLPLQIGVEELLATGAEEGTLIASLEAIVLVTRVDDGTLTASLDAIVEDDSATVGAVGAQPPYPYSQAGDEVDSGRSDEVLTIRTDDGAVTASLEAIVKVEDDWTTVGAVGAQPPYPTSHAGDDDDSGSGDEVLMAGVDDGAVTASLEAMVEAGDDSATVGTVGAQPPYPASQAGDEVDSGRGEEVLTMGVEDGAVIASLEAIVDVEDDSTTVGAVGAQPPYPYPASQAGDGVDSGSGEDGGISTAALEATVEMVLLPATVEGMGETM